ncbi:MAG: anti-sigma factor antagonist [Gemmiger sp.]|uniref:anti-sigma factor antagonist n=1 Tax=Gemmiger sp. TaxID=2049027 RepID=UPI002E795CA8|nr:anti-sigma factor antagonist [Gemmiger sp.]MEE0800204.1 anti-sigma factor antagonist [Gemmiger sp.]
MANVCFVPAGGTLAAYLTGEIDHHAAQSLRREIDAQVDARMPELLTMDFSGVTFMDSSGVGLILGRGRHMSSLGGRLTVQNAPAAVRRMLDLARIHYV